MDPVRIVMACVGLMHSYLFGSISFGSFMARKEGIDLQDAGSGSTGATNVARVLGKRAGLKVFVLDILKGIVIASFGWLLMGEKVWGAYFGMMGVLGHCLPYYSFPRAAGKGVATIFGVALVLDPLLASIAFFCVFVPLFLWKRMVSLGSLLAVMSFSGLQLGRYGLTPITQAFLIGIIFVVIRHAANIKRLCKGEEVALAFAQED